MKYTVENSKELIEKLFEVLNEVKGFEVGYADFIENKLIIEYKGQTYFVKLEKRPENESMFQVNAEHRIFDKLKEWE